MGTRAGAWLRSRGGLGLGWLLLLALVLSYLSVTGRFDVLADEGAAGVAPAVVAAPFSSSDKPLDLDHYRGRPVVLHFWSSWHADALAQATALERLSQDYTFRDQGVAVLGIAVFDSFRPAKDFVRGYALTYPNGFDADGDIARAYRVSAVPTTLFIDRDGRVVRAHQGDMPEPEYRSAVAAIAR